MSATSLSPSSAHAQSRRSAAAALLLGGFVATLSFTAFGASARTSGQDVPLAPASRAEAAATEISRVPYQAYLYPADCISGSNICKLTTEVVPAHKRLELHRLACHGFHSGETVPLVTGSADLQTAEGTYVQRVDLLAGQVTRQPPSTLSFWTIREQTLMFVPARRRLQLTISSGTPINGSSGCVLSGYLVTLK